MSKDSIKIPPLSRVSVTLPAVAEGMRWMNKKLPCVRAFIETYGPYLGAPEQTTSSYVKMSSSTHAALRKATTELHSMFVKATDHVCKNPDLWPAFGFPMQYWPRALASFYHGDKVLSGRLDFSVTPEQGIKCYEYNADSASCLFECGYTQEAWSKAVGVDGVGVDGGLGLEERLVNAWHLIGLARGTLVHFLYDGRDNEERYHTLYMVNAAQKAGLVCKVVTNVDNFSFTEEGTILDDEKKPVKYVWKTWAYTTLLGEWNSDKPLRSSGQVRLVDVCLNDDVTVFEPCWMAIPANKAILPVLSKLYPDHPNVLYTSWEVDERLKKSGYVAKPVKGRCGENIKLQKPEGTSDPDQVLVTKGRFEQNGYVYQELCPLPTLEGEYVQVNAFCIAGHYGGTVLRLDKNIIMNLDSYAVALRVVDDGSDAPMPTDEVANPYHQRHIILEKMDESNKLPEDMIEGTDEPGLDLRAGQLAPFGAVVGFAPGGIPAYSSDYKSVDRTIYPTRAHFRHQYGKFYYGYRYQCVEFARRWLTHVKGVTFGDVGMAYEIFDMKTSIRVRDETPVPWLNFENGSRERPVAGSVLIWNEGGEYRYTGHIAIVTAVSDNWVRVAEQNVDDTYWPRNQDWARQLDVEYDSTTGAFFIKEDDGTVKGWKNFLKDFVPEPIPLPKEEDPRRI